MKYHVLLMLGVIFFESVKYCPATDEVPQVDRVSVAIRKSIPLLERAAAGSAKERQCFTCHTQALPVFALAEVKKRGFEIDEQVLQTQLKHTAAHLQRGLKGYREGRGQGGRVLTAGYALWTLEEGDWKPDEMTTAVTHYLLSFQKDDRRWHQAASRPPSAGSDFVNTYVALRALRAYATAEQQTETDARLAVVGKWLNETAAKDTEDRVFRFRSLAYVDASNEVVKSARDELINDQQDDGGWSQNLEMKSDAYATGSVLAALLRDGAEVTDPVIKRGIGYLLDSQLEDGSWHVVTRAKPIQPYYETSFPHEKDQFISTSATGWATIALALTLPESPSTVSRSPKSSD